MLKLDSADLPTTATARKSAGFCRLYRNITTKSLGPIAICDFYRQYSVFTPAGFDVDRSTLQDPDYAGTLFKLDLGFTISSILNIGSFAQVSDPSLTLPGKFWLNGSIANIYATSDFPLAEGDDLIVNAIATTTLQNPDASQIYTISGTWTGFTISTVAVQGLTFAPASNPSSPQPGEFTNISGTLKLYGGTLYTPRVGSEVLIRLQKTYDVPAASLAIASYDLASTGVSVVDAVDHLGRAFHVPSNALNPLANDFFWSQPYLTLFFDLTMAIALRPKARPVTGSSVAGSLSYTSYEVYE